MEYKRLLPVNLFLSLLVLLGILCYRYILPKRNITYLALVIIISILPVVSIFRTGTYQSGDLSINVIKTISFFHALKDGVIFPSWAENLNAMYGYPLFIFTYPLPYYIASFFHVLGFSFLNSVKLLVASSFIASGISMYIFLETLISKRSAFLGTLLYLFAPYHLVDMHFRVDIGEMLSFVWIPLIMWACTRFEKSGLRKNLFILSFSTAALILSHQAVSLSFLPFLFAYAIFRTIITRKVYAVGLPLMTAILSGILLTTFYVLPIISYIPITHTKITEIIFPPLIDFFISFWRYGLLFQGHMGELSSNIGYLHWLLIAMSLILLIRHKIIKREKPLLLFYLFSFFLVFLFMQEVTKPLWYIIPLIKSFQFSTRLLVVESFFAAVIGGVIAVQIKNKFLFTILCCAIIGVTILNWGNRQTIPSINDTVLQTELPISTATMGEGLDPAAPLWTDPKHIWMAQIPASHIQLLKGDGKVSQLARNSIKHTYHISAKAPIQIKENTLYFPGWEIRINNKSIPFTYTSKKYPGIMIATIPKGNYILTVQFRKTFIQNLSIMISLFTFLVILVALFLTSRGQIATVKDKDQIKLPMSEF